jgi:hypothetical protein
LFFTGRLVGLSRPQINTRLGALFRFRKRGARTKKAPR